MVIEEQRREKQAAESDGGSQRVRCSRRALGDECRTRSPDVNVDLAGYASHRRLASEIQIPDRSSFDTSLLDDARL
jgi:hypothetical protein